jgi:hypothetical protein
VTITLTPRAPATGTPRCKPRATHVARATAIVLVIALACVLVATQTTTDASDHQRTTLAGPMAAAAPPHRTEADTGPAGPPAGRRLEPGPAPRGKHTPPPEPLSPQPPADRRAAPDPAVVHDGDRWALFSTQAGYTNVPVALSDDLRKWSQPVDALPELPAWAEWGHTWAPGVLHRDNGFVLYFAARSRVLGRQCIGAAAATTLAAPYPSPAPEPLVCQPHLGGSIDPQPFVDSDGTAYLLWKADANAIGQTSQLFAAPAARRPRPHRRAGCSPQQRRRMGTAPHRKPRPARR